MAEVRLQIFRGDEENADFEEFSVPLEEGMVVLDAIHWVQANVDPGLAVRWNCKAGKCGSCGLEIDGEPKLSCMTSFADLDLSKPIVVTPMKTFPLIRDLVVDVAWNFENKKCIAPFRPRVQTPEELGAGGWQMQQYDVERVQEFRKCIECFLCQDVCHVLRNHGMHDEFIGPRFLMYAASLEAHPLDEGDRIGAVREDYGLGLCNITKCCVDVCPEHINLTDNAIIPLKERAADDHWDPLGFIWRMVNRG